MPVSLRKFLLLFGVLIPLFCVCLAGIYFLPPVHERLAWRVDELILKIKYTLNPPGKIVFVPEGGGTTTPLATPVLAHPSSTPR